LWGYVFGCGVASFLLAQFFAVNLACRRFGQFVNKGYVSWVLVCRKASPHHVLNFLPESVGIGFLGDDERLDDLAAQFVGYADGGRLEDVGVFKNGVFDFDGAHGPACRNNDVVGATGMVEIAV